MPYWIFYSLSVNLGPISYILTFSLLFSKMYLCLLTNMKSLWLWKVTTCLPLNSGFWGNKAANYLATLLPNLVLKLLTIISGWCRVALPYSQIYLLSSTDETLKVIVGPAGKWIKTSSWGFPNTSLKTIMSVNFRLGANLAICYSV